MYYKWYLLIEICVTSYPAQNAPIHRTFSGNRIRRRQTNIWRFFKKSYFKVKLVGNSLWWCVAVCRPHDIFDVKSLWPPRLPNSDLKKVTRWIKLQDLKKHFRFLSYIKSVIIKPFCDKLGSRFSIMIDIFQCRYGTNFWS